MVNPAGNPEFKEALNQHRAFLRECAERHKDKTALKMLRLSARTSNEDPMTGSRTILTVMELAIAACTILGAGKRGEA